MGRKKTMRGEVSVKETATTASLMEKMGLGRPTKKPDPDAQGLHKCCYDDGLGLYTESLGFESYCDGNVMAGGKRRWRWAAADREEEALILN
ncbi:hypothetical protein COCNU_01G006510 [Cocos nucifera]|uniref:Uncharacterized protein n=1 Tax=Cocos nucifera TaxID=13894 RepID=A0A8K0HU27_COCNU|nr:hypothetical protein COCNU_01G006510 [Cocos nucifera]